MNKGLLYFFVGVAIVAVIGAGAFLVSLYYQAGSGEASGTISAPELSLEDDATATPEPAETEATEAVTATPDARATGTAAAALAAAETEAASDRRLYRISQADSEVRFELDEELFGSPKHVVGTTDQVAGDIIIDFDNPANSQVGVIRINARTFVTDNDFRNRAIRGQILQSSSDEYEYIEFTPSALEGLPTSGETGTAYEFTIVGDLQIRDVVQPVTFTATATLVDETRLEGSATTTVLRTDFGLQIPDVPSVANVTDEVLLTIEFVAPEVEG